MACVYKAIKVKGKRYDLHRYIMQQLIFVVAALVKEKPLMVSFGDIIKPLPMVLVV